MILDASAVLAFLFREAGAELVGPHLAGSFICSVNWSEILARFTRMGLPADSIDAQLRNVGCQCVEFSQRHALLAAELVPVTSPLGLSLGDRACLSLALDIAAPVLTADRAWTSLSLGLDIRSIR